MSTEQERFEALLAEEVLWTRPLGAVVLLEVGGVLIDVPQGGSR